MFGQRITRIEDASLLRGTSTFVDDIQLPGTLHACFVRSQLAHARIVSIDTAAAKALKGVQAIYTLTDLAPYLTAERVPVAMPSAAVRYNVDPYVLAKDEVCHVGEPIALIIAESRHIAEDIAQHVVVEYNPLPAQCNARMAITDGAAPARLEYPDNIVAAFTENYGDCDTAFERAAHVFRQSFRQHKGGGQAIECRGLVASYDRFDGVLTVWDATQMPHRAHRILVEMLGCAEREVRVVTPDVGGGFGPKFVFYPEEVCVSLAARLMGRPIKWIEDRRENFTATTQERDQYWDVEVAVDADARLLGIRGAMIHDHGAYTPYGVALAQNAAANLIGPYKLPSYRMDVTLALTNFVPATPTRGAGRPQGTFIMERLLDRIADEVGIGRDEVRRRNLIALREMPYVTPIVTRDGKAMTYDSGDYAGAQAMLLETFGDVEARQSAARNEGRYLGFGFANYVEGTGRGPFETATVRVGPSGRILIATGATAQGQGNKTTLAQICAGELGVDIGVIDIVAGDTAATSLGVGAFASRQAVTAGSSVLLAARAVKAKALEAASHVLDVRANDLQIEGGKVSLSSAPDRSVSLADLASQLAGQPGFAVPGNLPPGLEATANFEPDGLTYTNGVHGVEVEVDIETGQVGIRRYVVVHDCGRMINPMIVEGQIRGGVAHGIGNALLEEMKYDETGQPLTVTYADYLLPTSVNVPNIEILHMESPTPLNPLGIKGTGEAGTIPVTAAIASAIENALSPFGIRITETPITPMRIVELIEMACAKRTP